MSLYERIASTPEGERGLAMARLRRLVFHLIHVAGENINDDGMRHRSGLSRRRARAMWHNGGDVTINELAAWLWAGGYEAEIRIVPAGQPRTEVLARRAAGGE